MTTTFALTELVKRVRDRFIADAAAADPPTTPVPVTFGWREPMTQRQTSHRIIFVAGDDSGWNLGSLSAPESPQVAVARPLAQLDEVFTAYVEAEDVTAPADEENQYLAARQLYDAFYRAVYGARIPHRILSQRWVVDRTVAYAGAAIRVVGTVSAIVPDAPRGTAPADTGGTITVRLLDANQSLSIPPPEESP